jgi:hypothetical protein
VSVDAESVRRDLPHDLFDDTCDLVRQTAAVGVAQHDPARAAALGRLEAGECVARISRIAVEEMLGIEHHLGHAPACLRHALLDHAQVLVERHAERQLRLTRRALADQGDDVGPALEQGRKARVVGGAAPGAPGHAERAQPGPRQCRPIGEKAVVGGIGARPAPLDVIDPELIEHLGDRELVGGGEVDALGLGAVAQGGVVQIDALGHRWVAGWYVASGQAPAPDG